MAPDRWTARLGDSCIYPFPPGRQS